MEVVAGEDSALEPLAEVGSRFLQSRGLDREPVTHGEEDRRSNDRDVASRSRTSSATSRFRLSPSSPALLQSMVFTVTAVAAWMATDVDLRAPALVSFSGCMEEKSWGNFGIFWFSF